MSTKYVSKTDTNGYSIGNDGNSGTSKTLPYLTLDAAIAGASAGDTIIINGGTYTAATYYNVDKALTINPEPGTTVTLKRTGAVTRVMNIFSTDAVTLGSITLDAEDTASCHALTISTMATPPKITLQSTRLLNAGSGAQAILLPAKIKLDASGLTISHSSNAGGIIAFGLNEGYVNIDGVSIDNSAGSGSSLQGVNISAAATGTQCRIKGVSGTWKSSGSANSFIRTVGVVAVIEDNINLNLTGADAGPSIIACLNSAYQANSCVVRYNKGTNNCSGGYGVLIGSDAPGANDNKTNYPHVYGNEIAGTDAASLIHGVLLGNIAGGVVSGNKIRKCGIPLVSKLQTEASYFINNDIDLPVSGAGGCLRTKGSVNTQFSGNRVRSSAGYANTFVSVTKDPTIPTYSANVAVIGNSFYSSAAVSAAVGVGDGTDTSTASLQYNNYVAASFGGSAFVDHANTYGSVSAWKTVEATAMASADMTTSDKRFWNNSYRLMFESAVAASYPHLLAII